MLVECSVLAHDARVQLVTCMKFQGSGCSRFEIFRFVPKLKT